MAYKLEDVMQGLHLVVQGDGNLATGALYAAGLENTSVTLVNQVGSPQPSATALELVNAEKAAQIDAKLKLELGANQPNFNVKAPALGGPSFS